MTPDLVLAHAFGQRYDLPLPLPLFLAGGAAVVVLSFLLVLRRDTGPGPKDTPGGDVVPVPVLRPIGAAAGLLVLLALVVVGFTGVQSTADNIVPVSFWVTGWIVVPLSCGLIGNWTGSVNPFAALSRLADRPSLRRAVLARTRPLPWTAGWWPSVAVFVLLVLGELVFNLTATQPAFIATCLVLYAMVCAFCGLVFGPAWLQRGEVVTVVLDVWGRQGYWRFGAPGRRGFGGGLGSPFQASLSRTLLVLLMLVNINFDGLGSTRRWTALQAQAFGPAGTALQLGRTLSLLLLVAVVLAVFGGFAVAAARAGGQRGRLLASLAGLLPSLVPIAFGYLVAHYCSYVVTNLQLYGPLLGNPGYSSWPLHLPAPFTAGTQVDLTLVPAAVYWYLSVAAIVLGHVAAVFLAHRHLAATGADPARARASEYPWLAAMVLYTVFSLFLIAQSEASGPGTGSSTTGSQPSAAGPP